MAMCSTNVCRLCRATIPTKHSISLFSPGGVQQRLPTRITDLLDVSVASNDGLPGHICVKCKRRLESLEKAEDLVDFRVQATACQQVLALLARGPLKRTKESSGTFVSPNTAKARPLSKCPVITTSRMLDFGPSSSDEPERECTVLYCMSNCVQ